MSLSEKLDQVVTNHHDLGEKLANAATLDRESFVRMSKEYSDLSDIVAVIEELRAAEAEMADLEVLLDDTGTDAEMRAMAEEEYYALKQRIPEIEERIQVMLLPKDEADEKNAIVEVRAGTGGEEAALFAAELYRMYQRYAELNGWTFEPLSVHDTGIGGYKEASASIAGKGVFARLKYESGVHRVQRVPETESQGRVHTSAATVAVLPEAEEVDIHIDPKDLRVDTYRAQGAGGQHVNKTESASLVSS